MSSAEQPKEEAERDLLVQTDYRPPPRNTPAWVAMVAVAVAVMVVLERGDPLGVAWMFGIVLTVLTFALVSLRQQLRRFQGDDGAPRTLRLARVEGACPNCAGRCLVPAIMEDNFGPELEILSTTQIRADGAPIYEDQPLSSDEATRLDWARGMGHGVWCTRCRDFRPVS